MLIKMHKASDSMESEVTSESPYLSRRHLLSLGLGVAAGVSLPASASAARYDEDDEAYAPDWLQRKFESVAGQTRKRYQTPYRHAVSYNNFYGLGPEV